MYVLRVVGGMNTFLTHIFRTELGSSCFTSSPFPYSQPSLLLYLPSLSASGHIGASSQLVPSQQANWKMQVLIHTEDERYVGTISKTPDEPTANSRKRMRLCWSGNHTASTRNFAW